MKILKKIAALGLSCLMLVGCSDNSGSSQGEDISSSQKVQATTTVIEKKEPDSQPETEPVKADTDVFECGVEGVGDGIPVIAISTKDQSDNAIKFVTEPVTEHVAKSRASWDWGYKVPAAPYYEECTVSVKDEEGSLLIDGVDADVKVRGNWTTMYDKKPLRIKFAEKQSMLGLNDNAELKNWVLLAEYKDFSMLRNQAAFDLGAALLEEDGYYSSDYKLVELVINGKYWGVYVLAEQQQANKNRVDITKPEENYEGTDIGYFLEFDGYYVQEDKLHGFYVTYNNNAPLVPYDGKGGSNKKIECLRGGTDDVGITIKSDIYSQEQHDFISNYINNVYKIMYSAAYDNKAYVFNDDYSDISETDSLTPQEAVEKVVDVASLVDTYIINEIACDADIYWSSFFMDVDFGEGGSKKLVFEAPWDFDSAFGNKNRCAAGEGFYAANIVKDVNDNYKTINPWLAVLTQADWYLDMVKERWTKAYNDGVFDSVINSVTTASEKNEAAFIRNYERWNNIAHNEAANELCAKAKKCKTEAEAAEYLAEWLGIRVEFLNSNWNNG